VSRIDDIVSAVEKLSSRMDAYSARNDADPAKVKALYDRPGTPGEKAAAAAALRRMGYDPDNMSAFGSQPKPKNIGPKRYSVEVVFTINYGGSDVITKEYFTCEAIDEIDAETQARKEYKQKKYKNVSVRAKRI